MNAIIIQPADLHVAHRAMRHAAALHLRTDGSYDYPALAQVGSSAVNEYNRAESVASADLMDAATSVADQFLREREYRRTGIRKWLA